MMMESAGQLLLSAPPLQLPATASVAALGSSSAAAAAAAVISCFLPTSEQKIECDASTPMEMEASSASSFGSNTTSEGLLLGLGLGTRRGSRASAAEKAAQRGASQQNSSSSSSSSSPPPPPAPMGVPEQQERKANSCSSTTTIKRETMDNNNSSEMSEMMLLLAATQSPSMSPPPSTANGEGETQDSADKQQQPLPVIKPPGDEKEERPSLSYKDLIIEAIESSPDRRLKLSEIYQVIKYLHPYYQRRSDQWGWQNSIRHNLSLHDCFVKLPLKQTSANGVVGHFWTVVHRNPEDKQGPTRRRSRANNGSGGGGQHGKAGNKKAQHSAGHGQQLPHPAGGKAKGLKGRQSVSSDSGVLSDDGGGASGSQSGPISPSGNALQQQSSIGGSASVPPATLQIPCSTDNKFQPLQSPLVLSSHPLPSAALPFPSMGQQQQRNNTPSFLVHQQAQAPHNNLLTPLELVMNGQHQQNMVHAPQPSQQQHQQQLPQYSPIPGKTAPAQPALLEQQLQQLLAMANFSQQPPACTQPGTPASAPPTLLPPGTHHPLTAPNNLVATVAATTPVEGGLNLLSQLATQLAAQQHPQSPQLPQVQQQQQQNPLAVAAAAAAAELQRLQLLQLYAQQQQQQLHQHLAMLEQHSHREQQQQQVQHNHHQHQLHLRLGNHGGHSAPLSPSHEQQSFGGAQQQEHQQQQNSAAFVTQLLLARLLNSNSSAGNEQQQQQQMPQTHHHHQQVMKSSPTPPPMSAPPAVLNNNINSPVVSLFAQQQQQLELQQAALLLEQYQQQQQQQQRQQQLLLLEQLQQQQHQQQLVEAVAQLEAAAAIAAAQHQQVQAVQEQANSGGAEPSEEVAVV